MNVFRTLSCQTENVCNRRSKVSYVAVYLKSLGRKIHVLGPQKGKGSKTEFMCLAKTDKLWTSSDITANSSKFKDRLGQGVTS